MAEKRWSDPVPRQRNDLGPPGEYVRENVRRVRTARGLTTAALSQRLAELGRPIQASGITKIETGSRRVDVGDLVALAVALRVTPTRLLLPVDDPTGEAALTGKVSATQARAWDWALGRRPIMTPETMRWFGEGLPGGPSIDDFARDVSPPWERVREVNTAMMAARDLVHALNQHLQYDNQATARKVRLVFRRVVAEVEALVGDGESDARG